MPTTIDYFKNHPLRIAKDQRSVTIGRMRQFEKSSTVSPKIQPALGAFVHYGGVELADRLTILKPALDAKQWDALANAWYNSCGVVCKQLMFYVWHIINREMRHGDSSKFLKAYPEGAGENKALQVVRSIMCHDDSYEFLLDHEDAAPVPLGEFVDAIEHQYRHGGWQGGFGGKKWADIALELKRYIDGETSAMVACDRCWTLQHNTCSIFNKPYYFHTYDGTLHSILEAQSKSSVFTLADKVLEKYNHPLKEHFIKFMDLGLKAIHTVDPEYTLGSTGAVHADGKDATTGFVSGGGYVANTKIGPLVITTMKERVSQ